MHSSPMLYDNVKCLCDMVFIWYVFMVTIFGSNAVFFLICLVCYHFVINLILMNKAMPKNNTRTPADAWSVLHASDFIGIHTGHNTLKQLC